MDKVINNDTLSGPMACICGNYFVSLLLQPYFLAPSGIVSKRLCVLGVIGYGCVSARC